MEMRSESQEAIKTHFITCPLCEATCGLEVTSQAQRVLTIKGDKDDVFSQGYLCPKAYSLKELHEDPDRLRQPVIRRTNPTGESYWDKVSWEEAFGEIERRLLPLIKEQGAEAVGAYIGNPNVHNLSGQFYLPVFLRALGSRNVFTASTVDQYPKQIACGFMYGTALSVTIPDVDRTDYMLILGANPLVSNGSLLTAPGLRDRLRALRKRGGKIVVIDPVRTRTAQEADQHHFILPGSDAYLLLGLVQTLIEENLANPGEKLLEHSVGLETVRELALAFSPEVVAPRCGIAAETIRQIARDLAAAPQAIVYGRMGTCTQEFGTLTSWLVDVLNFLTGNLDREGGVLFPKAAAGARNASGTPGKGKGVQIGRWKSRVRGLPEVLGELPVACMAEEIETPGKGQIRALVTIAGNPILSTPNSARLQRAFESLDFVLSVDIYLNETSRLADVVLPPPSPLSRQHYDIALYQLATRNVANYSPPVFDRETNQPDESDILLRLSAILSGSGNSWQAAAQLDEAVISQAVKRELETPGSPLAGRDAREIVAELNQRQGSLRMLDLLLRSGPYGDQFGGQAEGLSLEKLEAQPHGVDLGPLQPRIPEVLRTPSGKIELSPAPLIADVERLRQGLAQQSATPDQMLLIGRRHLRSNNSWLHNLNVLVKDGEKRCTLLMHPSDARRLELEDGRLAQISSRVGQVKAEVELTENIMPGVVSLPHGWGHNLPGVQLQVAAQHGGVNSNFLTDDQLCDQLSGNAVLNGIPVTVTKHY